MQAFPRIVGTTLAVALLAHAQPLIAQYSVGQIPIEEPGNVPRTTPKTPVPDPPVVNSLDGNQDRISRKSMLIDERTVSESLKIAAMYGDEGDGRLVLNFTLSPVPTDAERVELDGAEDKDALSKLRERKFSEAFGGRVIYDPNYPLKGEVVSISANPSQLKTWIVKAANEFPQVTRIWAKYQQYEQVDIEKLPVYPVVITVPEKDLEFCKELSLQGMDSLGPPQPSGVQVIVSNRAQAAWLEKHSIYLHSTKSRESGNIYPHAEQLELPSILEDHTRRASEEADSDNGATAGVVATHYIWLKGRPSDEVEATLTKFGAQVTQKSSRRISFEATTRQAAQIKKAGEDIFEIP